MFFHLTNVKISLKILIGGKNIFYLEDKISTIGEWSFVYQVLKIMNIISTTVISL